MKEAANRGGLKIEAETCAYRSDHLDQLLSVVSAMVGLVLKIQDDHNDQNGNRDFPVPLKPDQERLLKVTIDC
jgi:hypothetical protein